MPKGRKLRGLHEHTRRGKGYGGDTNCIGLVVADSSDGAQGVIRALRAKGVNGDANSVFDFATVPHPATT